MTLQSAFIAPTPCTTSSTQLHAQSTLCHTRRAFSGAIVSNRVSPHTHHTAPTTSPTPIVCAEKKDQFNYNIYQDFQDRSKRSVTTADRAVVIQKPLGVILEEGQDGMVFVAEVDPEGNAADTGEVFEGDILVAVSATFGEEVWSTRGVGLDIVMKSIRIRAGNFVTLVLESPAETSRRKSYSASQAASRREEARDKFGEREVLDPVTWTSISKSPPDGATYEYGDPEQAQIDDALKEKLKKEVVAPYEQNWILWIGAGILVLVILSVAFTGN